jgi:integrase
LYYSLPYNVHYKWCWAISDRYLKLRNGWWYYQRRVPKKVAHLDDRGLIQLSLDTQSLDMARLRRDAQADADDALWQELKRTGEPAAQGTRERYDRAVARSKALGFVYRDLEDLATAPLSDIVTRIEKLQAVNAADSLRGKLDAEALFGGADKPQTRVSEAMEEHIDTIGSLENRGKSPKQIKSWEKVKRRASANFVRVVGDIPMIDITRANAVTYFNWWRRRVVGVVDEPKVSPNSANRDLGNMRKLYKTYFELLGEEERPNPFRGLRFDDPKDKKRASFSVAWIHERFLVTDAWNGLNADAALLLLSLIETGCRPSEVANILPANIRLTSNVPHIVIEPVEGRAIKTRTSRRTIPLVGVSLAAFRARPGGFPRYHDKEDSLSATLMKHLRRKDLLPSDEHSVYSIRHSFEDRMLEGGLDADLRRRLMGHKVERPDYGVGGDLAFRAEQLQKIALPFPDDLVARLAA